MKSSPSTPTVAASDPLKLALQALVACGLAVCGGVSAESAAPLPAATPAPAPAIARVPGTGQTACFNGNAQIVCPSRAQAYYGQDGNNPGPAPRLRDNGDGTATDQNTGLMWTRLPTAPIGWTDAQAGAGQLRTGGYSDWRLPTIKELYTLIDFGRGYFSTVSATSVPFIDTTVFDFAYTTGDRFFDVQEWSATPYVATTMNNDATVFGVNFADGRIKGYPRYRPGSNGTVPQQLRARYVRGPAYGLNQYADNGNGTVTDAATSLTWQQIDDGMTRDWREALAYCAALNLGAAADWRLPNAKELHTIVDYRRAPATTGTAAIAAPLQTSAVESYYWTSTTIADGPTDVKYRRAAYFAFGRALGWMAMPPGSGNLQLLDVHGAGSQRADFKTGDPTDYPQGLGPQGDEVRIRNAVRCVRGGR